MKVLITGASSGIGAALAREFAAKGADLILIARRTDRLQELAREIEALGRSCLVCAGDVTQPEDLKKAVQAALDRFGQIDVAVANAGFGVVGRLERLTVEDYRRQFETNVFGLLNTVYATLEPLKKSRGSLVLIGSIASYISVPAGSPYSMSKFAVRALAESLRPELAPHGVAVTLISPGFIESEIRQVDNKGKWHAKGAEPVSRRLVMPATTAARQMVHAIVQRRREKIITWHGYFATFAALHFRWLIAWLLMRRPLESRKEPSAAKA